MKKPGGAQRKRSVSASVLVLGRECVHPSQFIRTPLVLQFCGIPTLNPFPPRGASSPTPPSQSLPHDGTRVRPLRFTPAPEGPGRERALAGGSALLREGAPFGFSALALPEERATHAGGGGEKKAPSTPGQTLSTQEVGRDPGRGYGYYPKPGFQVPKEFLSGNHGIRAVDHHLFQIKRIPRKISELFPWETVSR